MVKKEYKFYCSDPFGDNNPDDIFNKRILPILMKYSFKEKDIDSIVNHIDDMLQIVYENGGQNEAFSQNEFN